MAKKRKQRTNRGGNGRRPMVTSLPDATRQVDGLMSTTEFDLMLAAGDGLFWQRHGDNLKLYSPEVVRVGIETMWDMWERINALSAKQEL